jgi:N-acetyl-gamma-glutamyl-phosphate reductase
MIKACRINGHRPRNGDTPLILAIEDNLVKGTSGLAVPVKNLMFGLPEATGLTQVPALP